MQLERIKVADLKLDANNARQHDQTNLAAISGSLTQFGQRKPIVVDSQNTVVAGNGTLEAARLIGWTEIDCVRVPADWNAEQIKAYALADNRTAELAQWIPEVLSEQLTELEIEGFEITAFGFKSQIAELPENLLDEGNEPRLDQRASITCPSCGCEFRKTAQGFEVV
jgi:ParB-like chromosome segregation protein Spo0J